jgi:histidinol-phosphatase (PHP family)
MIKSRQNGLYRELDYTPEIYRAILDEDFGGDVRLFVETFYKYVEELLGFLRPTVLGHLDLIKKNNPGGLYFKESAPWYRGAIERLIPAIKASGAIVEVNTGGLARKKTAEVYPSPWIVRLLQEAQVPIMLNSDAHSPENLDAYYDVGIRVILEAGYDEIMNLHGGSWVGEKISG